MPIEQKVRFKNELETGFLQIFDRLEREPEQRHDNNCIDAYLPGIYFAIFVIAVLFLLRLVKLLGKPKTVKMKKSNKK